MSGESDSNKGKAPTYRIPSGSFWDNAWKVTAVLAAVGIVGAIVGATTDLRRFAFSYLFAFIATASIALGALFWVLIVHFTKGAWSVAVRRTLEFFVACIPLLVVLAVPVVLGFYGELYEWADVGHGDGHGGEHGGEAHGGGEEHGEALLGASTAHAQDAPGHGQAQAHGEGEPGHGAGEEQSGALGATTPQEEHLHHELLAHKAPWLNVPFWQARAALYLLVWALLAFAYWRWSTTQDRTRDPALTRKMEWWSPLSIVLLGLTLTFAAFDWIMSLQPTWFSTIYGVYVFAGAMMSSLAATIVVGLSLYNHGLFGKAVSTEHFHDLGKLMFGFMCFWAYIGFSQWMLIWYVALPEETTFFHIRGGDSGWFGVSLLLILGHFAVPFIFLISRNVKRRLPMLGVGATWLIFIHIVDIYWLVMPYAEPGTLALHWVDVASLFAVAGVFVTAVFLLMRRYPLVPVGDPRLSRSIHFVQTQ